MSADLIPEILEADAKGEIARIYAAIRERWSVPNVTTITRHMATVPGCLEWLWATMAPAMAAGDFQETAWDLVRTLDPPPLAPLPAVALRAMGVSAADEGRLRDVFHAYNRNNPPNLLFVCCLKRLLETSPGGTRYTPQRTGWTPPPPPPELVPMLRPEEMPARDAGPCAHHRLLGLSRGNGVRARRLPSPGPLAGLSGACRRRAVAAASVGRDRPRQRRHDRRRRCRGRRPRRGGSARGRGLRAAHLRTGGRAGPVLDGITPKIPEMIVICRLLEDALPGEGER